VGERHDGASGSAQVVADDPRKYGDTVTMSTALPSSSGGMTFPVTFRRSCSAGHVVSGLVRIDNPGNIAAPLMVRFDGDVTGPRVYHQQTGKLWAMAGFNIPAGQWVVVTWARQGGRSRRVIRPAAPATSRPAGGCNSRRAATTSLSAPTSTRPVRS
jgi:hypothetical protein